MRTGQIGSELRRARKKAGLTQAALAERMKTSQSAIARSESGAWQPSLDFIERFVAATGEPLQLGDLFIWSNNVEQREAERRAQVRKVVGSTEFNPWERNPSPAEQASLIADGLTREYFESKRASSHRTS